MIQHILKQQTTFYNLAGSSKKRVLQNIADAIHENISCIDSDDLFKQLTARERLGSTGGGKGVAIPHCRSKYISESIICLVKLQESIDFDANDKQAVDLLFVLLVPQSCDKEHLNLLRDIASLIEEASFRNKLRNANSAEALFHAAVNYRKAA